MSELRFLTLPSYKFIFRRRVITVRRITVYAQSLTARKTSLARRTHTKELPRTTQTVSFITGIRDQILSNSLVEKITTKWDTMPTRYQIVGLCCAIFVLCNMDKVNLSLTIIPMANEYNWPASVSGLVQSSFFWGYMVSQIPGGYLCSRIGGRRVLPYTAAVWTCAIASIPFFAGSVPALCLARASVGLAEAVAPSAITDMVARTVPTAKRSRAMSAIYAGLSAGNIIGLFLAPFLIEHFEWESVFFTFAFGSTSWILLFEKLMSCFDKQDPIIAQKLTEKAQTSQKGSQTIPFRGILRNTPVRALAFTHLSANYFNYTMLTWLPSYFTRTLDLDLRHAALVSLIPPVLAIAFAAIAGSSADKLVGMGWKTTTVRKLCQTIGFIGPAACLLGAGISSDSTVSAGFVTLSLGLASFSLAGLYCNHQDLSPQYSSFLLGLTNTAASIPGIVGVWLTGYLLDQFDNWEIALFFPCILFFLAGSTVFLKFGSAERQTFENNEPFQFEKSL